MRKELVFIVFIPLFILTGNAYAHQHEVHQYVTGEAFRFLQRSFHNRSSGTRPYANKPIDGNSTDKPFSNYRRNYCQVDYMRNCYFMRDKNSLSTKTGNISRVKKICKELAFGGVCGVVGSVIGTMYGVSLAPENAGAAVFAYAYLGAYAGYTLFTPLGVYVAGNDRYERGSYFATFGGSFLGAILGLGTFFIFDNKDVGIYLSIIGPPIGSIVGFNLSKRPKEQCGKAFINHSIGRFKLSLIDMNYCCSRYCSPAITINLFKIDF